ncbi:ribosomal protein L5 domain-containing protein [Rhodocollybia butyracea]|uniref:Ribosomal protein L5 domain-containing protein n=1 Tax=Rhodocollybia butyracea TaxID=206335 RepID=A0A9P5QB96_9AGAR|nr:ribosomal protein L5 domain-containing protein [Rhodocollybia butyracea]
MPLPRQPTELGRFGRAPYIRRRLPADIRRKLPRPPVNLRTREYAPCRLGDHYHSTLADNLMYMNYTHTVESSLPPKPDREIRLRWDPANPYSKYRKNEPVGGKRFAEMATEPNTPANIIRLEAVQMHIMIKEAITSRMHLLGVIAALRALSGETEAGGGALAKGVKGVEIVRGKKQVGGWIRSGVPVGAKVTLKGSAMYDLIACLTEFVLPRLREFHGIPMAAPVSGPNAYLPASSNAVKPSDVTGVVSFGLPPEAMSYWPQIEVNQDAYPRMYGMHLHFITNAVGVGAQERARALVSGFQIPFLRKS